MYLKIGKQYIFDLVNNIFVTLLAIIMQYINSWFTYHINNEFLSGLSLNNYILRTIEKFYLKLSN